MKFLWRKMTRLSLSHLILLSTHPDWNNCVCSQQTENNKAAAHSLALGMCVLSNLTRIKWRAADRQNNFHALLLFSFLSAAHTESWSRKIAPVAALAAWRHTGVKRRWQNADLLRVNYSLLQNIYVNDRRAPTKVGGRASLWVGCL